MLEHARQKLIAKSLDAIIANYVAGGEIFGRDVTEATLIFGDSEQKLVPGTKSEVSQEIFATLSPLLAKRM